MRRIRLSRLGAAPACLWLPRVCAPGERKMIWVVGYYQLLESDPNGRVAAGAYWSAISINVLRCQI